MPAATINTKEELISAIKEKIMNISGNDAGRPVKLENVPFYESGRPYGSGKIYVASIFINEDGNLCADMYRSGSAGCIDFICGLDLNSADEKNLKQIISALDGNRWSVAEPPVMEKQKKRNLVSSFKIPFLKKGA